MSGSEKEVSDQIELQPIQPMGSVPPKEPESKKELSSEQETMLEKLNELQKKVSEADNQANQKKAIEDFILAGRENAKLANVAQITAQDDAAALADKIEKLKAQWLNPPVEMSVTDIEDKEAFIQAFNDYAKKKGWEEGTFSAKENAKGGIDVSFPTEKDGVDFFKHLAEKNEKFVVVDASSNKIIAYSDGDGTLKTPPEGNAFTGEKLTATEIDAKGFEIPQVSQEQGSENTDSAKLN